MNVRAILSRGLALLLTMASVAVTGAAMLVMCLATRPVFSADLPTASATSAEPVASAPLPAPPPEWPLRTRPPSFDYAQCANLCQMERDHALTACLVPDNPNKPDYPRPADCSDGGRKQFLACMAMCPTDVGAPDQP